MRERHVLQQDNNLLSYKNMLKRYFELLYPIGIQKTINFIDPEGKFCANWLKTIQITMNRFGIYRYVCIQIYNFIQTKKQIWTFT